MVIYNYKKIYSFRASFHRFPFPHHYMASPLIRPFRLFSSIISSQTLQAISQLSEWMQEVNQTAYFRFHPRLKSHKELLNGLWSLRVFITYTVITK